MNSHDTYKHLIGVPYKSGADDCYGLAMKYYRDVYGINLIDFARPEGWWDYPEMDLINQFVTSDGWESLGVNTRLLKPGDGLIFSLISGKANHVGCYVGNGLFIHHIWNNFSREEALLGKWTSRLLMIVRHPMLEGLGEGMQPKTDITDILPEHIRAKLRTISNH